MKSLVAKMRPLGFLCLAIAFLFLLKNPAFAYRPYQGENAAVTDKNQFSLELGLPDFSKEGSVSEITLPGFDLSYGFMNRWGIGYSGEVQIYKSGTERNGELDGSFLYLNYILKEGVLQDQSGVSVMVEAAILLPSTKRGERRVGFGGLGAISGEVFNFGYNLSVGAGFVRKDFDGRILWGVIIEYPFDSEFRIGLEFNGNATYSELPENSGLIGIRWELGWLTLDSGARMGFSEASSDWELTSGITIGF